ncbi:MAG: hypothetical protein RXO22_05095 [Thermocladium sp.]|nr:MAG: hypothetical protein AT710_09070 [Thermocladium sp. ECH_B]
MRITYAGRRAIYEELLELTSDTIVSIEYIDDPNNCGCGDLMLLDYYIDSNCNAYRIDNDVTRKLARFMAGETNDLMVGADAGSKRFGIVLMSGNELLMHATLTPRRAVSMLKELRGSLAIGNNALGRSFVREVNACGVFDSVTLVNEAEAAGKRDWLRDRYPSLESDELDAVAIALSSAGGIDACHRQKIKIT